MRYFILALTIVLLSCKKADNKPITEAPSQQKTINLSVDGIARNFILYLPTGYSNQTKLPMIFVLHGGTGTAEGMQQLADFTTIANRDKIVLVYPSGIQNSWNDGRPTKANQLGIDDINFFRQMCDYMLANYAINGSKIYATGISNGGFMSSRLACELNDKIAAVAVVAASIEQGVYNNCNPSSPMPTMYIQGTLDPFVPFMGGTVSPGAGGVAVSHTQTIAKWISINHCNPIPLVTDMPDIANDGTSTKQRIYTNSTNKTEVVSYIILNGGHTWPQGPSYLPESIIGKTSQDINANEIIWQFFKRYSK